jgi:hypothetical protein
VTWAYRIVRFVGLEGCSEYAICEVYFDNDAKVSGWIRQPAGVQTFRDGPEDENAIRELQSTYELLSDAFKHPVITVEERLLP